MAACNTKAPNSVSVGVTPEKHSWLAIKPGAVHALGNLVPGDKSGAKIDCQSCHPADTTSFTQISCTGCHTHEKVVTDRLHATVADYVFSDSAACYTCHPSDHKTAPYDHGGIKGSCAMCHDVNNPFAALPKAGFTHPPTGGSDCAGCHGTKDWKGGSAANGSHDPANDLLLTGQIPTYSGTSISSLTPLDQSLPMPMDHGSTDIAAAANSDCSNCHADSADGLYFPGNFHSSLANLAMVQPTSCASCHLDSMPVGFVGPPATNPPRVPASGEMKHDAVAWLNGARTTTAIVTTDCGVCHRSPSDATVQASAPSSPQSIWASTKAGTPTASFHQALMAAGMPQPTSCLDCHAGSRPSGVLTSANSSLAPGTTLDHGAPAVQGDCASCHATGGATQWSSWRLGKLHPAGAAAPATCLPCHAAERPTTTSGWISTTYKSSPFDYVTNAVGTTHGDGQDCALCHGGPGTGAWGGTQNWAAGHFAHGPQTVSRATCLACHSTQRPDLQSGTTAAAMATALGFDHSLNGTGECFGCHQASVTSNTFANFNNPATGKLPGGDWKGGQSYPGSSFTSSSDQFIQVTETALTRAAPAGQVTGTTTITETIYNGMLHVSSIIPAPLAAGPTGMPDNTKCWHCHTNNNGTVTAFKDGQYHTALTKFSATPGGAVVPFPQPTAKCNDCHSFMRPDGIVSKDGSSLWPMDHTAVFATPVTVAGALVARVTDIDCSVCHKSPGVTWADGVFHPNLGSAVVSDCAGCHYTLIVDGTKSDVQHGTDYTMKHNSKQVPYQGCQTCHPGAVGDRALLPASVDLWQTGTLHSTIINAQPTSCIECHAVSEPIVNVATASATTYVLKTGGTTTNGTQWMNHGSSLVAGKDCAVCHAADAQKTIGAWSKSTSFHAAVPAPKTCQECHGLTNGLGAVAGTKNNLPAALTSSTVTTSASAASGIAAGTLAQISHNDVNVAMRDCNFCHTQIGISTAASIQGKEWAQARFHAAFVNTNPLVMNTTTGRCSNCHMNDKPGASFAAQDHAAFTTASGSTDCSACHAYPGTGSVSAPNWLGAEGGVPTTISVGGFMIAEPPATTTSAQTGISNLPHPTVAAAAACTSCHKSSAGGRNAIGYDHKSALINANCSSCHEAGSDLLGVTWNGATAAASGAGDTRPFSIAGLVPSTSGNSRALSNGYNHFFAVDCHECHSVPAGNGSTTTGTTYRSAWKFNHQESKMKNPSTCNMCHASPNNIPKG